MLFVQVITEMFYEKMFIVKWNLPHCFIWQIKSNNIKMYFYYSYF